MKVVIATVAALLLPVLNSQGDDALEMPAHGKAEHVVLVVWDGMRPDFVTEKYAPTLFKLSHDGVVFQNNHAAYVTSTEVNGTVLSTGVYPDRSHLIANIEYRPSIDPLSPFGTEMSEAIRKGDADGKYIAVPTVEEILQAHGFRTVVAGTKAVALLPDRSEKRVSDAAKSSVVIYNGKSIPPTAIDDATRALGGAFPPEVNFPNVDEDAWTTRALTEFLWKDGVPKFSLLWMSDPDFSQHNSAPGAPIALGAIKSVDDNLARVLAALDAKGVRDTTDVIVVSDHGFSTVEKNSHAIMDLTQAGFSATDKFKEAPKPGDLMVVSVSGSLLLYVSGHDAAVVQKLVDFFQGWGDTGVILTKQKMTGTFTLEQAHVDSPEAPDVMVSLRWDDNANKYGVPGSIHAEPARKVGQGMHATLSKFDMHNTLIAEGPDFKHNAVDGYPTGNVDVAPTILWLLGVTPPAKPDGRVLFEALAGFPYDNGAVTSNMVESARNEKNIHWRQYLKFTHFKESVYLDEGNGEQERQPE
ncbi:MAG TPA: alkaline phosphatase family protein [Chthoniobacteraceae bacterium]|nr:alkaline phosphatase family protein [Chthoniobacteraceae bacterium]